MDNDNDTMMTHDGLDMSPEELAALMSDDDTEQAPAGGDGEQAPAAESSGEAGGAAPAAVEGVPAEAAGTGDEGDKPKGDVRAALRAARRGEHRARQEADRLRRELEDARAAKPTQANENSDDLTDEDIEEVSADFPKIGKALRVMRSAIGKASAETAAAAAPSPQPEFEPEQLPPEVQDDVDSTPDLLAWQHAKDQSAWEMAKAEDRMLLVHPKWRDKPQAERFAEVARRVRQELAETAPAPSPTAPPIDKKAAAIAAIERAPRVTPRTLNDIGAGGEQQPAANNLGRYASMSDDDIVADLLID